MPKRTQFDRNTIVFEVVPKELSAEKLAYLSMVWSMSLKNVRKTAG